MNENGKRVALLIGQADEEFQTRFLDGFLKKAKASGLGVFVFNMCKEYQNTALRERGDSSVFDLIDYDHYDGVVVLADTIQTEGLLERLEERIHKEFRGSVLFVDGESRYFKELWTDSENPMRALTEYLIEDCGYRDFAFLNGKEWHSHSKERLRVFRTTLEAHGLILPEERIYNGDFWYTSGDLLAGRITDSGEELPEIIVCANDMMAVGLAGGLIRAGTRIPEDIGVAGFDSSVEGRRSPKLITSVRLNAVKTGECALESILLMMEGKEPAECTDTDPVLFFGETTRESKKNPGTVSGMDRRRGWPTIESSVSYSSVHNTFDADILNQFDLEGFLTTFFDYLSQMDAVRYFDMVLDSRWINPDPANEMTFKGELSDQLLHAVFYDSEKITQSGYSLTEFFDRKELLPNLGSRQEKTEAIFFSPLFSEDKRFGYVAITFKEGSMGYAVTGYEGGIHGYDIEYARLVSAISRGLEGLIRTLIFREMLRRDEEMRSVIRQVKEESREARSLNELTPEEKKEYAEVMRVLDQNLFHYHFQPIVDTKTGGIYSYEALMRTDSALPLNPLKVLRYAELANRLSDVEKATFLNVLGYMEEEPLFKERAMFINSIPGIRINKADTARIEKLLMKHSRHVVVEFTEQAELGDKELFDLKERIKRMGVGIALDDYGTGYSNVNNLLRYVPNIVKIDRALLSNIENSAQKQHFVREIIDFCHENGILALAEGVETSEELRMVILFGADLIQGYYTGRPAPELLSSLDDDIRREIRRYHQERLDGYRRSVYVAGRTNRVLMSTLIKDRVDEIVIGEGRMTYRDIRFIGIPGQEAGIRIDVAEGYEGTIALENVRLEGRRNRPCITVSQNSRLTIILDGENSLNGGGIEVEEGGELQFEGDGKLSIRVDAEEYFAIGAGLESRHGKLIFSHHGEIDIDATGTDGIAIGSGKGGSIELRHGRYRIKQAGNRGVSFGSFEGNEEILVKGSDISTDISLSEYVCFGSLYGNTEVHTERSLLQCYATAGSMSCFGTVKGEKAKIFIHDANVRMDMKADRSTGIGALEGETELYVDHGGVRIIIDGEKALAFGGYDDRTKMEFVYADVRVDLQTLENRDTYAKLENIKIKGGRSRLYINDLEYERELTSP
ncbi:MAG: EAL domain-containing protein [Lachnospiraceae bacterium]|nr:EAL domain-containing protein [Lachnospiraceae bacterium]